MAREVTTSDSYLELVSKLIPGEIVAVYLAVQSLLVGLDQRVIWAVIAFLFVLTPVYLLRLGGVTRIAQAIFSGLSFLVWVYAVAPATILGPIYNPQIASIVLILWTLLIPLVVPKSPEGPGHTFDSSSQRA